jgi:hypothetical protein
MALSFNLAAIPLKYVAFPIVAGLAAGTGALAAYVTTPSAPVAKEPVAIVAALPVATMPPPALTTEQIAPAKAKKLSCEEQTWPYIDNRCIARKGDKGGEPTRTVRFVVAPREEGGIVRGASPRLITSDGVLRGPGVAPEADAPKAKPVTPTVKKAAKRADRRQGRDEAGRVYSVYSVPSSDAGSKPVIVVRPARVEQYSSRY